MTIDSFSVNSLATISFIGGSYRELAFDVYNSAGSPVNLTSFSSCQWLLSPFGQPEVVTLIKTGTKDPVVTNRFWIYLYSTDTATLSGKYVQQPVVVAMADYEFRLGQGYVNIIPASSFASMADGSSFTEQLIAISGSIVNYQNDTSASIVAFENEVSGSIAVINTKIGSWQIATTAQATSGSSNTAIISASALSHSDYGKRTVVVPLNTSASLVTTDVNYVRIPSTMNGWILTEVAASCSGSSSSGSPVFTVSRCSASAIAFTSMLSTDIKIDEGEFDSSTASTQPVISTSASSVFTGYKVKVGVSTSGSPVTYAQVSLTFRNI